ncbi:MAG: hypothetical protein PF961_11840, partial [Planctomycetota bacterium]|nr:hypothetical protein [Planctomycetota bacterium]
MLFRKAMPIRGSTTLGLLLACPFAAALSGAETHFENALRLPIGSPQLVEMARTESSQAVLEALASEQAERRHGAARLLAHLDLPPAEVLAALVASDDPEVRRLGTSALRRQVSELDPAALLALTDADLVCPLLARHEGLPLSNEAVRAAVEGWLKDPATTTTAADLVVQRGDSTTWAPILVASMTGAALGKQTRVLESCHRALELLTGTQRSLAPYAGHYDLLAKDWQDVVNRQLAETPSVTPEAEVLALVAELPDDDAMLALLGRRSEALAAVEQIMAGAPRARRKQLQYAARLLERAVSPTLYTELGVDGLANMDAEHPRERRAALTAAAVVVLEQRDVPGLQHLLSYADDRDATVRSAAFDRLVRLSDERKSLGGKWKLSTQANAPFPASATVWRLRRALQDGASEEQIAALQLISVLDATELRGDIHHLLLASNDAVIDSAIDALHHIDFTPTDAPVLLRLARDPAAPAARRAHLLDLMAKEARDLGNAIPTDELTAMVREETDPLVRAAALKAMVRLTRKANPEVARKLLLEILTEPNAPQLLVIELLEQLSGPEVITTLANLLAHDDENLARRAALTLLEQLDDDDHRTAVTAYFTKTTPKETLLGLLPREDGAAGA